jgi:hypothetical protein
MKPSIVLLAAAVSAIVPFAAFAQTTSSITTIPSLFSYVLDFINTILVPLVFAVAFIVFLFGIYRYFIEGAGNAEKTNEGRQFLMWGLIGFFVMFSVWGLVNLLLGTLGFNDSAQPTIPTFTNNTSSSDTSTSNSFTGSTVTSGGVSYPVTGANTTSSVGNSCPSGYTLTTSNTCVNNSGNSTNCQAGSGNACAQIGNACTTGYDCASGLCQNSTCVSGGNTAGNGTPGSVCTPSNSNCSGGSICDASLDQCACPDGTSLSAEGSSCVSGNGTDGSAPAMQDCSDGTQVPVGQSCPTTGSMCQGNWMPSGDTCCSDGSYVPAGYSCPTQASTNSGSGGYSPGSLCPDGSSFAGSDGVCPGDGS